MNISFLLAGKPSTFLLYFLSFENSVCALYILERRFIKHYLFLQPRRVVVKEAPSVPSATLTTAGAAPSAMPSAAPSAAPSTSSAPSTSAEPKDLYARLRLHQAGEDIEQRIAAALRRFKELSAKPSVSMRKLKKTYACWAHNRSPQSK